MRPFSHLSSLTSTRYKPPLTVERITYSDGKEKPQDCKKPIYPNQSMRIRQLDEERI